MAVTALAASLAGCGGGGGGGGDYIGAALVSLEASPRQIDPGDRTQLTIRIAEVDENGIALKIKFPVELKYVSSSTTLETSDRDEPIIVPVTNSVNSDPDRYLVYYFKRSRFGEDNQGTLRLQLEAVDELSSGKIQIDADVDDPKVSNTTEFQVSSPEFGAEDEVSIEIKN